jgi:hypothetical protein
LAVLLMSVAAGSRGRLLLLLLLLLAAALLMLVWLAAQRSCCILQLDLLLYRYCAGCKRCCGKSEPFVKVA